MTTAGTNHCFHFWKNGATGGGADAAIGTVTGMVTESVRGADAAAAVIGAATDGAAGSVTSGVAAVTWGATVTVTVTETGAVSVAVAGEVAVTMTGGGVAEFIGCSCLVWS